MKIEILIRTAGENELTHTADLQHCTPDVLGLSERITDLLCGNPNRELIIRQAKMVSVKAPATMEWFEF